MAQRGDYQNIKPDHFIALQITDPEIHKKIGEVQKHILSQNQVFKRAMIPLPTLHFTLMVVRLGIVIDIQSILKAMDKCIDEIKRLHLAPLMLDVKGLGTFRNKVLFAKVTSGPALDNLKLMAGVVNQCFTEAGYPSASESDEFEAHLTIMKLSKDQSLYQKGIKQIDSLLYEKYMTDTMGRQTVASLQLCSMVAPMTSNGYYPIIHEVGL